MPSARRTATMVVAGTTTWWPCQSSYSVATPLALARSASTREGGAAGGGAGLASGGVTPGVFHERAWRRSDTRGRVAPGTGATRWRSP